MLPLVLTVALLAWVVSLLNRFVGPSSLIGRGFAAIGQPLAGDSPLAYLLGTALLLVAIYLLGLGVQLGLKRPLANLFDLTLRRTPLIGNLYNLADRFRRPAGQEAGRRHRRDESGVGCLRRGRRGGGRGLTPPKRWNWTAARTTRSWCRPRRSRWAAACSTFRWNG